MKQTIKQQRASFEMLCQKAGIISRELDAKLERMEALAAKVEEDKRVFDRQVEGCAEYVVRCIGLRGEIMEAVRRRWRWTLWVDVPLCVLLVVDVVMRWV